MMCDDEARLGVAPGVAFRPGAAQTGVRDRWTEARRALNAAERKTGTAPVASLVPAVTGGPPNLTLVPATPLDSTLALSPAPDLAPDPAPDQMPATASDQAANRPRLRLLSNQPGAVSHCTLGELTAMVREVVRPGAVTQVTGSMSALFAAAAAAWQPEMWGVLAALPNAGLLAAAQAGLPLARCVVIPDLGVQPLKALAGLVDAFGVVVTGPVALEAVDRRRIEARLRRRRGCLVTGGPWGGAAVRIEVQGVRHEPLGQGGGPGGPAWFGLAIRVHGHGGLDLSATRPAAAGPRRLWAVGT